MISQRQKQAHKSSESIEVFYGIDKIINAIIDFVNGSKHRYDVYADSKGPLYVTKIEALRKAYIKFVSRGGQIRFITEITRENLSYCKEVMKLVELRHIEGIRGIVRINEIEYQSNLAVLETKLATILLRSTLKRAVELQQNAFDTLWEKAIPAEHRIKEIEIEQEAEGSKSKEPHNTIQLWTNHDQDEYAIRLGGKSDLLVATTHNTQYTILIDESEYIPELEYDWQYTMMHWIENVSCRES